MSKRGGKRSGAGRKNGSLTVNRKFELYLWLMVELLRDRKEGERRRRSEAMMKLKSLLGVDWTDNTIKNHYRHGRILADEFDGATMLRFLRQKRDEEDWQPSVIDLIAKFDAGVRSHLQQPAEL